METERDRRKRALNDATHAKNAKKKLRTSLKTALNSSEPLDDEQLSLINGHPDVVKDIQRAASLTLRRRLRSNAREENLEDVVVKVNILVDIWRKAKHVVVYTGAGISTSTGMPDYRGPNGLWTSLSSSASTTAAPHIALVNLEPSYTHMALASLIASGHVQHIVSQNCDGLHMRSGVPVDRLSLVHGDSFVEVCLNCSPPREYIRSFDTTPRCRFRRHATGRLCDICNGSLEDSIVLFGEYTRAPTVCNWPSALWHADNADLVVCIGSSLKVLQHYPGLFPSSLGRSRKGDEKGNRKLAIVNLMWTPKDYAATLKIQSPCDDVMAAVLAGLGEPPAPSYCRMNDPLGILAIPPDATQPPSPGWLHRPGVNLKNR